MDMTALLNRVEQAGNRLPAPALLFLYLSLAILALSALFALFNVSASHPVSSEQVSAINLLSQQGLHKILTQTVSNFAHFGPVGSVMVAIIGIGLADKSGLIRTLLSLSIQKAPKALLSFIVVLAGVLSNIAMDTGYVVLIPLAAVTFAGVGRHPLVGLAAAFAGVSGGYSANLLIGPVDAILAGISTEAAQIAVANYQVNPTGNYYFMLASTLLVAIVGTWVTEKVVAPRYETSNRFDSSKCSTEDSTEVPTTNHSNQVELPQNYRQGLKAVAVFTAVFIALILMGLIPEQGILRSAEGGILNSPLLRGIVTVIALYTGLCGYLFGRFSGEFKSQQDIVSAMEDSMRSLSSYLVLIFFAAQFVNYFKWSQLGSILAIQGASLLQAVNVDSGLLLTLFIFIAAFINLFIGSASAKWALLAPIFVPMLMAVGISPEASQVAFRIGDSSTNIITPLMPYFGVVMAFAAQHQKNCGVGTVVALMLPYSIAFLVGWSVLLLAWFLLGLPLGPGVDFMIQ